MPLGTAALSLRAQYVQPQQVPPPPTIRHAQWSSNISNSTNINGRSAPPPPSSSHSIQQPTTTDNSPTHSTDTSRPETETEDDENIEHGREADNDVDMDDSNLSTQLSSVSTATGAAPQNAAQVPQAPSGSVTLRTRQTMARHAAAAAAAIGIVSNDNTPHTTPAHHIIINEDLGDLGFNRNAGVRMGAIGGVGVEDRIVSLDQQANEDFAMVHLQEHLALSIQPQGLLWLYHLSLNTQPAFIPPPSRLIVPSSSVILGARGRSSTAPEPAIEPLISLAGPSNSGLNAHAGPSNLTMADISPTGTATGQPTLRADHRPSAVQVVSSTATNASFTTSTGIPIINTITNLVPSLIPGL
ncbi:hypothetical protein NP233_g281 [Leucocoprinus birnbaumii]|uniref:Uncharacterized protein n=1 Tax=Leucocoprinus birnbaumii TaxID=56174 RepID=A0AAD5W3Z5_9AGAR|nr:hypothetical protein NP233_g281 [Leucocoprinus birnbaumii]